MNHNGCWFVELESLETAEWIAECLRKQGHEVIGIFMLAPGEGHPSNICEVRYK